MKKQNEQIGRFTRERNKKSRKKKMFFKTNKSKNKAFLETRTFFTVKLNMKGDGRTIF